MIAPLIPRLRTGACDMEETPNPHLSEEGKTAHIAEVWNWWLAYGKLREHTWKSLSDFKTNMFKDV